MISLKVVVMMVILFSISYYLYALPLDKNQKLVGILGAVSSVALIFTIYQAYMQYQYDSTSELVRFNVDYWEKILEQTSDELYTNWYGGDFGGLSIERHKEWSRIASNIEAINKLNGYSANGYDFSGNEGWRNIIFNWVHDPEFQMYWQTDVGDRRKSNNKNSRFH